MAQRNIIAAGVLIVLSIYFLVIALEMPLNSRQPFDPGPGFFPALMLFGIIGLSVLVLIFTFLENRSKAGREETPAEAEQTHGADAEPKTDYVRFAAVLALVVAYAFLLTKIGMVLTNLLFVFAVLMLYSRKWIAGLLISLAYTAILYIVFIQIIRVYFKTDIVADWLNSVF